MLNLGPIIKSEKYGWEGGLWPWKYGQGEGSRGTGNPGGRGVKNSCHPLGCVDFFWNNPIQEVAFNAIFFLEFTES